MEHKFPAPQPTPCSQPPQRGAPTSVPHRVYGYALVTNSTRPPVYDSLEVKRPTVPSRARCTVHKLSTKALSILAATILIASSTTADDAIKPVRRDAPFHAYWATAKDQEKSQYQFLLITHGPLEDLAGHTAWSKHPLDNMAFTFKTYGRDSFWSAPFTCVQEFGAIDAKAKSAEIDGATYAFEECPLEKVTAMLNNPDGTKPIARIENQLHGAEQTAKAFRLLLMEQLASEKRNR